jgi:hypothetical protein
MSRFALVGFAALMVAATSAQETDDSFEVEPPVLPQNLKDDAALAKSAAPAQVQDVAKLEKDLEHARRSAAGAERLYRMGALAKIEAESRALRVVRLESNLENARLVHAKEQALSQQNQTDSEEAAKTDTRNVDVDLVHAIAAAHAAAAKRERAELEAAEINLHRQEKLLALGSARKSDVARAEQKLAELREKIP